MSKYIFFTQVLSTIYVTSIFYQEFVDYTNGWLYMAARVSCVLLMIWIYIKVDKKK